MQERESDSSITARRRWRHLRQDVRVFVRLFPWHIALIMGAGLAVTARLFQRDFNRLEHVSEPLSYLQALLSVIKILQLDYDLPVPTVLDPYFALLPLIGLPLFLLFGVKVFNVVRIFFVRQERGPAWQAALAATANHHILICGVGRVGYRLARQLLELGLDVVGLNDVSSSLTESLADTGMPVLLGDVRNDDLLRQAGVTRAATVVVCTDDDLVNIEGAFRIQELNPQARIVLRLFEDEIAETLSASLDVAAIISRSALAAVAFAHAALGLEIVETFQVGAEEYVLTWLPVRAGSPLAGRTVAEFCEAQDVAPVLLRVAGGVPVEPDLDVALQAGDALLVFAASGRLGALLNCVLPPAGETAGSDPGQSARHSARRPVAVCGLGHTGYRVALRLLELGQPVLALDFESGRLAQRLIERGVRVVFGDLRQPSVLATAGVGAAGALVACSEDDILNLEVLLRAREVNPNLRTVLRLFEEDLGARLQQAFGIDAVYSTSAIASPAFLSAVLNLNVAQSVSVDGGHYYLARLSIGPDSALVGSTPAQLNAAEGVTVALHARQGMVSIPPAPQVVLQVGDELVVLASQNQLRSLGREQHN
ncbi:MAG: potassium channel protein [Anaerolineae bacterium]|nr:potassium channel protein [Anaerolineae bacterium]